MVTEQKGLGPVKRFGVRYGATVKYKRAQVEIPQKKPQSCPYCGKPKAVRLSLGIFQCTKCSSKFTGQAYTVTPIVVEDVKEEVKKAEHNEETEEIEGEE